MQRVNPFLELFKLFSQAPDCRGLWTSCFQGGRGKWRGWFAAVSSISPKVLVLLLCSGQEELSHLSGFFQAEPSVLASYFLGVRWKFLRNESRRQKGTYSPPIIDNLREVRQEGTTECFQFASEQKERAKENWNALVKPDTPRFFRSGPKWRWHLKRMPALPGICLKTRCCTLQ